MLVCYSGKMGLKIDLDSCYRLVIKLYIDYPIIKIVFVAIFMRCFGAKMRANQQTGHGIFTIS